MTENKALDWFWSVVYLATGLIALFGLLPFLEQFFNQIDQVLLGILVIATIFWLILVLAVRYFLKKARLNYTWGAWSVFFIVLFLLLGMAYIGHAFGVPSDTRPLYDGPDTGRTLGSITCKDSTHKFIANTVHTCTTSLSLTNTSATITFKDSSDRVISVKDFSDLKFVPPPNTNYVFISGRGLDTVNKSIYFELGYQFKFLTKQEENDRQNKIIFNFLAVLAFAISVVPVSFWHLKQLFMKNS